MQSLSFDFFVYLCAVKIQPNDMKKLFFFMMTLMILMSCHEQKVQQETGYIVQVSLGG